ncbi:MAG: hypothetical protein Hyperionvirus13_9 [Hyperionvirus sp.]|uniref:Uncharacterized protein n=1 Tax=Hyperionvirus sp. TaxID=2487770 RepID=A0A3G5A9C6_9VIRU|nr:MAG: hypothetical protein Hyperionvirus13_9 [Hyperionvirus sp.]
MENTAFAAWAAEQTRWVPKQNFNQHLRSMKKIGASTMQIDAFVEMVNNKFDVSYALSSLFIPEHTCRYVESTMRSLRFPLHQQAAYCYYGQITSNESCLKLIESLPDEKTEETITAAIQGIESNISLWDGIYLNIKELNNSYHC